MFAEAATSVWAQTLRPAMHLVGNGDGRREAHVLNELIDPADCDAYMVLNDDDYLLPECLERCATLIDEFDIVYPWPKVEGRPAIFDLSKLRSGGGIPITALIRKSVFALLDGYRAYREGAGREGADGDFYARALNAGATFTHIPERLWVYRFHGDNMSLK